ncbi:MAG: CvpA family protein [Algiphilus sp.]
MNWVDYCVIAAVVVSAFIGVLRGFVREALNLSSWVLAVVAAILFGPVVDGWLVGLIALDPARLIAAYLAVFIGTLIVGSVVTYLVASAIRGTPFSGADRALGALFGTARGLLLVILVIAGAGLTVLEREPWWQSSVLVQSLEPYAAWAREQLPREWIEDIQPSDNERAAFLAPLPSE